MQKFSYSIEVGNHPKPTLTQQFHTALAARVLPKDFAVASAVTNTLISFSEAVLDSA